MNTKKYENLIANSFIVDEDVGVEHVDRIKKIIEPLSTSQFTSLIVRICEWEINRNDNNVSNLFKAVFKAVADHSNERPSKEPLLIKMYLYKGISFRMYAGTKHVHYKISMRKRVLFTN